VCRHVEMTAWVYWIYLRITLVDLVGLAVDTLPAIVLSQIVNVFIR